VATRSVSFELFSEIKGRYGSIGELSQKLVEAYDRHLHEIPAGFGVARLLDAGAQAGWIRREPDRTLLVEEPTRKGTEGL